MGDLQLDRVYEQRFIERHQVKVDRSAGPEACWPWTGSRNGNGYGTMRGGRLHISETGIRWVYQAHRVALGIVTCPEELTIFQFMDEEQARLEAAHGCHNRLCCNPAHLAWKSHRANIQDVIERNGGLGMHAHDKGRRITT